MAGQGLTWGEAKLALEALAEHPVRPEERGVPVAEDWAELRPRPAAHNPGELVEAVLVVPQ
ncbi:MAG: hypothetical protein CMO66_07965 [Verrucomicrobiales bacterium]|nr:hypothetical protein [Verrucomicrobiales bacterium]